jgi:membrane protease subunit (stomatin/prohibitin family)
MSLKWGPTNQFQQNKIYFDLDNMLLRIVLHDNPIEIRDTANKQVTMHTFGVYTQKVVLECSEFLHSSI